LSLRRFELLGPSARGSGVADGASRPLWRRQPYGLLRLAFATLGPMLADAGITPGFKVSASPGCLVLPFRRGIRSGDSTGNACEDLTYRRSSFANLAVKPATDLLQFSRQSRLAQSVLRRSASSRSLQTCDLCTSQAMKPQHSLRCQRHGRCSLDRPPPPPRGLPTVLTLLTLLRCFKSPSSHWPQGQR
jgi:hypothetical protein